MFDNTALLREVLSTLLLCPALQVAMGVSRVDMVRGDMVASKVVMAVADMRVEEVTVAHQGVTKVLCSRACRELMAVLQAGIADSREVMEAQQGVLVDRRGGMGSLAWVKVIITTTITSSRAGMVVVAIDCCQRDSHYLMMQPFNMNSYTDMPWYIWSMGISVLVHSAWRLIATK